MSPSCKRLRSGRRSASESTVVMVDFRASPALAGTGVRMRCFVLLVSRDNAGYAVGRKVAGIPVVRRLLRGRGLSSQSAGLQRAPHHLTFTLSPAACACLAAG